MHVEIWSDIACPWCYVGKRRFQAALAQFEHRGDVQVTWRSFELDPAAPRERAEERTVRMAEKYGISVEQARESERQLVDVAAAEGLDFRFDIARSGTTFDAHRLVHLAERHGRQGAIKERLLRAYFSEGELMSDRATLMRLAVESGLPEDEVRETLAGERYANRVREDEATASALGISAVPTFVVDRALAAAGAQPAEQLLRLLREGWARSTPASVLAGVDEAGSGQGG